MNLHLFLDVLAWVWGILATLGFFAALFLGAVGEYTTEESAIHATGALFPATLCWAWIIAG